MYDDESFNPDEPVVVPIEDWIDLHTYSPKETRSLVVEYLEECRTRGFPLVRIIHGKGLGIQREIVHSVLRKSKHVIGFHDAPPEAGHWGATIVYLKTDT